MASKKTTPAAKKTAAKITDLKTTEIAPIVKSETVTSSSFMVAALPQIKGYINQSAYIALFTADGETLYTLKYAFCNPDLKPGLEIEVSTDLPTTTTEAECRALVLSAINTI